MTIILAWVDPRIRGSKVFETNGGIMTVDSSLLESCFWVPQFRAHQVKEMKTFRDDLDKPFNVILANGTIVSLTNYRFVFFCKFDLEYFPMDIQSCEITFRSVKATRTQLRFATHKIDVDRKRGDSDLIYDLIHSDQKENEKLSDLVSSELKIHFVFKRRLHLSLMTTYFPSLLATIVSFTSFWIHPDAAPGRVTLGVTCLLALMTQMVSVRSSIMNMNYVTGIDVWFLGCISFVALSMFEFALSYTQSQNKKIEYLRVNARNPSKLMKLKWNLSKLSTDQLSRVLFPLLLFFFVLFYFISLISFVEKRQSMFLHEKHGHDHNHDHNH